MKLAKILLFALALSVVAAWASAGMGTITGREPGQWDDRPHPYSVIVARITDVADASDVEKPNGIGLHKAKLHPLATLAGTLDPSARPVLRAVFHVGQPTIPVPPKSGTTVLAVVQTPSERTRPEEPEEPVEPDTAFIVSDYCLFMPDNSSLVQVTGLGDERVLATLRKVQDARSRPEPDANRRATSRPATQQSR